mmetsp:Transcript_35895/g.85849  ORF Transcript_35895/g.85849 Transcript_35895/m.85849 type:complete len:722 (-) Transcript_35895:80-2245(-)
MVGYGANRGIVPISCEEIFRRIEANADPNLTYEISASMVEIYNEQVQDLLVPPRERPKKGLEIRESQQLGIYIAGVAKRPVDSYKAIEGVMEEGTENRTVGSTLMNATSSRAHTVIIIEFKQVSKIAQGEGCKVSLINLVDLAGSEKAGQTGASGDRLKEGCAINKSLSALGNVIEKLAQKSSGKKSVIVPYRESKLTRLLQNALGGSSKTIMICALSPASSNYEETLSTLRYADRAKKIKNNAVVNENPQEKLMRELREENLKLKEFMDSVKDTLGEQDAVVLNERVKEIKAAEDALKESQKSFTERLQESKDRAQDHERRRNSRRTMVRNNVFGKEAAVPHIVNLNEDMLLTGRIKHKFPENKAMTIGQANALSDCGSEDGSSDSDNSDGTTPDANDSDTEAEPDIQIAGEGVKSNHATITNTGGRCVLRSKGKAADLTYVNGVSIAVLLKQRQLEKPAETRRASIGSRQSSLENNLALAAEVKDEDPDRDGVALAHGDRLAFSHCLFLYVDPLIGMAEMLIMSGEVSYFAARKELAKNQWKSAGLKFMKGMKMQKAFGAKELSNKLLNRMSDDLEAKAGEEGSEATRDEEEDGEDSVERLLAEGFDEDTAVEVLRDHELKLEAKDRELADLRRQLAEKDAQLAEARAALAAGIPLNLDGAEAPGSGALLGRPPPLVSGRRPADVRAEIAATFESAISAIEQVEAIFTVRHPARKQLIA